MLYVAVALFVALTITTLLDVFLLFIVASPLRYERTMNRWLNLGDANKVQIIVTNTTNYVLSFRLHEGFPTEMQERSLTFDAHLSSGKSIELSYDFVPKKRGQVLFQDAFFLVASFFRLANRRVRIAAQQSLKVYPSILQLKKYELIVFHQERQKIGIKRFRRLGNNSEFEQIKDYVPGDELRAINWKATSRTNTLMTNTYQEEKSQNIVCVLDKSRMMQMEFDQLSLLDYSINSILALSNILIKNGDKAGLITFADKIGTKIPATKTKLQMQLIMDALYNQTTLFNDPNYELMAQSIRQTVKIRSLIMLFTNFETEEAFNRALPTLIQINQKHVVVIVMFQNSDIELLAFKPPTTIRHVYQNIVAEQMITLKDKLVRRLQQNKIQTILTTPHDLSINAINKYLELKAKGFI